MPSTASDPSTSSSAPRKYAKEARPSRRRKFSQERVMVMFVLFFVLGILLLVVLPEGHMLRGLAMTAYSVAVFWALFRFGM